MVIFQKDVVFNVFRWIALHKSPKKLIYAQFVKTHREVHENKAKERRKTYFCLMPESRCRQLQIKKSYHPNQDAQLNCSRYLTNRAI